MNSSADGKSLLLFMVLVYSMPCCSCNYTVREVFTFLNDLYMDTSVEGCGTPIKCDYPGDGEYDANSTNEVFPCCYDCHNCTGDRCYRGWQCCKTGTDGHPGKLIDDTVQIYSEAMKDDVTCEQTFTFEKFFYNGDEYVTNGNPNSLPENVRWISERILLYYETITKCSNEFSVDIIRQKCEYITGMNGTIMDKLPYINLKTFHIFRNKFCAMCNNADEDTVPFSLMLAKVHGSTYYQTSFESYILDVNDLNELYVPDIAISQSEGASILLIAVPEHIGTDDVHRPTPCEMDSNKAERPLPCERHTNATLLKRACELFELPLKGSAFSERFGFKNLACGHCEFKIQFQTVTSVIGSKFLEVPLPQCRKEDNPAIGLVLNLNPAVSKYKVKTTSGDDDNEVLQLNIRSKGHISETICPRGYFWDSHTNICRRILCPRRHYIHRGKCEPLFRESIAYSYYIKLKVSSKLNNFKYEQSFIDELKRNVTALVKEETGLNLCGATISGKQIDPSDLQYFIVEFWLTPKVGALYGETIKTLEQFFDGSISETRDFPLYIAEDIELAPGDITFIDRGYLFAPMFDGNDGTRLTSYDLFKPFLRCGGILPVSKLDFCYRVLLDSDVFAEVEHAAVNKVRMIRLNTTGVDISIPIDNYEVFPNKSLAAICIEDYIKVPKIDNVRTKLKQGRKITNLENADDIDTYLYIGLSVLAAIVFLSILYCRIRGRQIHSQQEQN